MLIVLSPAKTLDYSVDAKSNHTAPQFLSQSSKLIKNLKEKEPKEIASLMGLSDKLASLNFDRYQSWKASKTASLDAKPSMLVFKGDVYQGLEAENFNAKFQESKDEYAPVMFTLKDQNGLRESLDMGDAFSGIFIFIFILAMSLVLWNTGLIGGLRRYNEFGIRLALGESKNNVFKLLLIEASVIGLSLIHI